jgi:hypothetical protein
VSLVSRSVASSLIALIIALTPLFVSASRSSSRESVPRPRALVSMALGLTGVIVLVGTPDRRDLASVGEITMILGAILSWSFGSVLARRIPLPSSSAMSTAAQMLVGRCILIAVRRRARRARAIDLASASLESLLALLYLVFIGSIVGFGAYAFLLKHTQPSVATSYAYVNPLIALVLGHTPRARARRRPHAGRRRPSSSRPSCCSCSAIRSAREPSVHAPDGIFARHGVARCPVPSWRSPCPRPSATTSSRTSRWTPPCRPPSAAR